MTIRELNGILKEVCSQVKCMFFHSLRYIDDMSFHADDAVKPKDERQIHAPIPDVVFLHLDKRRDDATANTLYSLSSIQPNILLLPTQR